MNKDNLIYKDIEVSISLNHAHTGKMEPDNERAQDNYMSITISRSENIFFSAQSFLFKTVCQHCGGHYAYIETTEVWNDKIHR